MLISTPQPLLWVYDTIFFHSYFGLFHQRLLALHIVGACPSGCPTFLSSTPLSARPAKAPASLFRARGSQSYHHCWRFLFLPVQRHEVQCSSWTFFTSICWLLCSTGFCYLKAEWSHAPPISFLTPFYCISSLGCLTRIPNITSQAKFLIPPYRASPISCMATSFSQVLRPKAL